jgi:hypothetical protein
MIAHLSFIWLSKAIIGFHIGSRHLAQVQGLAIEKKSDLKAVFT